MDYFSKCKNTLLNAFRINTKMHLYAYTCISYKCKNARIRNDQFFIRVKIHFYEMINFLYV